MTTESPTIAIPALHPTDVPAFTALCFHTKATLLTIPQFGHVPPKLYDDAARLGLTITGPVQYVYEGVNGDVTNEFSLIIALPIRETEPGTLSDGFSFATLSPFRCVTYTHEGSWELLMPMYDALFPAFYEQGYQYSGDVREVYVVIDLEQPERCSTNIQVGIND